MPRFPGTSGLFGPIGLAKEPLRRVPKLTGAKRSGYFPLVGPAAVESPLGTQRGHYLGPVPGSGRPGGKSIPRRRNQTGGKFPGKATDQRLAPRGNIPRTRGATIRITAPYQGMRHLGPWSTGGPGESARQKGRSIRGTNGSAGERAQLWFTIFGRPFDKLGAQTRGFQKPLPREQCWADPFRRGPYREEFPGCPGHSTEDLLHSGEGYPWKNAQVVIGNPGGILWTTSGSFPGLKDPGVCPGKWPPNGKSHCPRGNTHNWGPYTLDRAQYFCAL